MAHITTAHIAALLKELDKIEKLDLDPAVAKKYGKQITDRTKDVQDMVEGTAKVDESKKTDLDDYKAIATKVIALVKEVLAAQAMAKKNAGPTFKIKGNDKATEAETIAFIKKHLPSDGYGNITQSLNDVMLGRGKSTKGLSGVLHASSGIPDEKPGKKSGCTLFFTRKGEVSEIVGIGQHVGVPSSQKPKYYIHFSDISGLKQDKEFQL